MALPTWNGSPLEMSSVMEVQEQAFAALLSYMSSGPVGEYSMNELLHFAEAGALIGLMCEYVQATAVPLARARGASLSDLSRATGLSRSTLQTKRFKDLYAECAGADEIAH